MSGYIVSIVNESSTNARTHNFWLCPLLLQRRQRVFCLHTHTHPTQTHTHTPVCSTAKQLRAQRSRADKTRATPAFPQIPRLLGSLSHTLSPTILLLPSQDINRPLLQAQITRIELFGFRLFVTHTSGLFALVYLLQIKFYIILDNSCCFVLDIFYFLCCFRSLQLNNVGQIVKSIKPAVTFTPSSL